MSTTATTVTITSTTGRRRTSYRRDPLTAALICIVAATALLRPAAAAPVSKALTDEFDSWWYNSCDNTIVERHHSSKHNKNCAKLGDNVPKSVRTVVRREMKRFQGNYLGELSNINKTYADVMNGFTPYTQPGFEWLPKFQKPTKHNRSKVVLRNYHLDLQKYVVAVHYLSTLKPKTEAKFQWQSTRTRLITKLSTNMKALLCEIETAVNDTCQTVPERIPASFAYDHGLNKTEYGLTDLYLVDWGVLTRFSNFMKESKQLANFLPLHKELDSAELDAEHEDSAMLSAEADADAGGE